MVNLTRADTGQNDKTAAAAGVDCSQVDCIIIILRLAAEMVAKKSAKNTTWRLFLKYRKNNQFLIYCADSAQTWLHLRLWVWRWKIIFQVRETL